MKITATHVKKAVKLIKCGLSSGLGKPNPGEMCIEAVWCNVLGLPHGDDPQCVTPYLRRLKISLNDRNWSSNGARAKGMLKLGVAQVGSLGVLDEAEFQSRVITITRKVMVPIALRAAASVQKKQEHIDALNKAATDLELDPSKDNCIKARYAAAAYAADAVAAAYVAYAAADAADAAAAAAYAAYAAYAAADAAAAAADEKSKKRDEVLTRFADEVLTILIDMKAPGCKWLHLCE
jgi:hypothetical protein